MSNYSNGLATASQFNFETKTRTWFGFNLNGTQAFELKQTHPVRIVRPFNREGLSIFQVTIKKEGKKPTYTWGIINRKGEVLHEAVYTAARIFDEGIWVTQTHGAIVTKDNPGGWQFLKNGQPIGKKVDKFHIFRDNFAGVLVNGKWGVIDSNADFVVEPQFNDIRVMSEGLMPAMIGDKWGYIRIKE